MLKSRAAKGENELEQENKYQILKASKRENHCVCVYIFTCVFEEGVQAWTRLLHFEYSRPKRYVQKMIYALIFTDARVNGATLILQKTIFMADIAVLEITKRRFLLLAC